MTRPYRSINYNDERKWKSTQLFDDVLQVGIKKAIGYICSNKDDQERDKAVIENLVQQLFQQGKLVSQKETAITLKNLQFRGFNRDPKKLKLLDKSLDFWTFYVGDKDMIANIINQHQELLTKNNWKIDPEWVFNKICKEQVDHYDNQELYHVVCDLFNSWCLHCEEPDWTGPLVNKEIVPLSRHPYDPDAA